MILDAPPVGWKRPSIPLEVQVAVLKKALATALGAARIDIDHRPPLFLRKFDPAARGGKGDTIPPANDPAGLEAITGGKGSEHQRRTNGTKATSAGSDANVRAKIRRSSGMDLFAVQIGDEKRPRRHRPKPRVMRSRWWPKRKFPKRKKR